MLLTAASRETEKWATRANTMNEDTYRGHGCLFLLSSLETKYLLAPILHANLARHQHCTMRPSKTGIDHSTFTSCQIHNKCTSSDSQNYLRLVCCCRPAYDCNTAHNPQPSLVHSQKKHRSPPAWNLHLNHSELQQDTDLIQKKINTPPNGKQRGRARSKVHRNGSYKGGEGQQQRVEAPSPQAWQARAPL